MHVSVPDQTFRGEPVAVVRLANGQLASTQRTREVAIEPRPDALLAEDVLRTDDVTDEWRTNDYLAGQNNRISVFRLTIFACPTTQSARVQLEKSYRIFCISYEISQEHHKGCVLYNIIQESC